ncbi:hypothetical protein SNEBB_004312, partial [Seison nebaliae]
MIRQRNIIFYDIVNKLRQTFDIESLGISHSPQTLHFIDDCSEKYRESLLKEIEDYLNEKLSICFNNFDEDQDEIVDNLEHHETTTQQFEECIDEDEENMDEDDDEFDVSGIIMGNELPPSSKNQLTAEYIAQMQHWCTTKHLGWKSAKHQFPRVKDDGHFRRLMKKDVTKVRMSASMKKLDIQLYRKLIAARDAHQPLNGRILRRWAMEVAKDEKIPNFKASES